MINKNLLLIACLLMCIGTVSATHEQINETLYIYNTSIADHVAKSSEGTNIKNVVCENGIGIHAGFNLASIEDYDLEYELHYAPNSSTYFTTLIRIKQETVTASMWGLYKKITHTLYIDSIEVASYNNTFIINIGILGSFSFESKDESVRFGTKTIENVTLFFTEMVMVEQYKQLENETGYVGMTFHTSSLSGASFDDLAIRGFVGIFLSAIKKLPFNIGDRLYSVLQPILLLIQYSFDLTFTFLDLIFNDWWYALLLLECICLYVASQKTGYVNVVSAFIQTHFLIVMFLYHQIIIPIIELSMDVLHTIKDMIKWW